MAKPDLDAERLESALRGLLEIFGKRARHLIGHVRGALMPSSSNACLRKRSKKLKTLARPAGLEPAAPSLEGSCSIQLSYGRVTP